MQLAFDGRIELWLVGLVWKKEEEGVCPSSK
jgi:hypothetical protein